MVALEREAWRNELIGSTAVRRPRPAGASRSPFTWRAGRRPQGEPAPGDAAGLLQRPRAAGGDLGPRRGGQGPRRAPAHPATDRLCPLPSIQQHLRPPPKPFIRLRGAAASPVQRDPACLDPAAAPWAWATPAGVRMRWKCAASCARPSQPPSESARLPETAPARPRPPAASTNRMDSRRSSSRHPPTTHPPPTRAGPTVAQRSTRSGQPPIGRSRRGPGRRQAGRGAHRRAGPGGHRGVRRAHRVALLLLLASAPPLPPSPPAHTHTHTTFPAFLVPAFYNACLAKPLYPLAGSPRAGCPRGRSRVCDPARPCQNSVSSEHPGTGRIQGRCGPYRFTLSRRRPP